MSVNGTVLNYFTFGTYDYVVFVVMLLLATAIGVYFGFFSKSADTTDEYLMGGKRMKTLPIAISLVASQLSGISIISLPAEIYSFGISHIFGILAIFVCVPVLCFIVIPVFYNNNISNCYEYLEMRFNKRTRRLVTAIFVCTVYLMMPVFIFIPALAFSQVTGANIHLINGVVCFVCVIYTMLGGIKAVVWTDVIQGLNMLGSVLLVGIMGTYQVGGLGKVLGIASEGGRLSPNTQFDLTTRVTMWNTFIGGIVMWTGYVGFNQSCVQRIVALPSLGNARRAIVIFGIGFLLISGINCFIGTIAFARYFDCDPIKIGAVEKPDKLMPFFVQDIIGHLKGLPGVFISSVFSAALSTMSANLNSLSGIIYFDYIKPYINHTEHKANLIMKAFVFVSGFYCLIGGFVVGKFKSIVQMIITISSISHGAIFGIFTLGMFVPRAHGRAGFYGVLFGLGTVVCMIIGAQLRFKAGLLKYEPLPTRSDGCSAYNVTKPMEIFLTTTPSGPSSDTPPDSSSSIFDLSFHWYKVLGGLCVWLLAIPLSYILPPDADDEPLNPKLLTPLIQRCLPASYHLPEEMPLNEKFQPKPNSNHTSC